MGQELQKVMKTFVQYPPRKMQGEDYSGPINTTTYEKVEGLKNEFEEYKINIGVGN